MQQCKLTPKLFRDYMENLCPISKSEEVVLTGSIKEGEYEFVLDEGQIFDLSLYTDTKIKTILPKNTIVTDFDEEAIFLSNAATEDYEGEITFIKYTMLSNWWIIFHRDNILKGYIEKYTRRPVCGVETVTEWHSGNGGRTLQLNRQQVVDVLSLKYIVRPDVAIESFANNSFALLREQAIIRLKGRFFYRGDKNIEVIYTVGTEETPDEIVSAGLGLMADLTLGHLAGLNGGALSFSVDSYSKQYGNSGKWTEQRIMQARMAHDILGRYASSVIGG